MHIITPLHRVFSLTFADVISTEIEDEQYVNDKSHFIVNETFFLYTSSSSFFIRDCTTSSGTTTTLYSHW
jgi:hypothetical protein